MSRAGGEEKKDLRKGISVYWKIVIGISTIILVFNLIAFSRGFCTAYTDKVYCRVMDFMSRVPDMTAFPIGEIIMYLAAGGIIALVIIAILLIFLRKKSGYKRFAVNYFKATLMAFCVSLLIYTFAWGIPVRGYGLSDMIKASDEKYAERVYSYNELLELYKYIVVNLNYMAWLCERDEDGHLIYPSDIAAEVRDSLDKAYNMENVAGRNKEVSRYFNRLGFYKPAMKDAICSPFLEWMGITGFTYPYSTEVTGSSLVTRIDYIPLYAHELSHHLGYYLEGDATFVSIIAGMSSDDPVICYGALLEAEYYVGCAVIDYANQLDSEEAWNMYNQIPKRSTQVMADIQDFIAEADQLYQVNVSNSMSEQAEATFSGISAQVADVGWSTQAEILGDYIYDGCVELLLMYYDGVLY